MRPNRPTRRLRVGRSFQSRIIAALLLLLFPSSLLAADVFRLGVQSVTLGWDPPTHGVADAYVVSVSRNGGPETAEEVVTDPRITLEADFGDDLVASIRAVGRPDPGAAWTASASSPPSDRFRFYPGRTWSAKGLVTLHCGECAAIDLRDVANPGQPDVVPGYGEGWQVVGIGQLHGSPGLEAVWFHPTERRLEIALLGAEPGVPLATPSRPIEGRIPLGLVDANGDGIDELLLRDPSNGTVEVWRMMLRWLVPVASFPSPAGNVFLSGADYNGDGTGDLWWRTELRTLEVWRLRAFEETGTVLRMADPGAGLPVGVGDFDGDGRQDVLWRDDSGVLKVRYLGPDAGFAQQQLLWIPGDEERVFRGVADFDGVPGVEILVQRGETGSIELFLPQQEFDVRSPLIDTDDPWVLVDARNR